MATWKKSAFGAAASALLLGVYLVFSVGGCGGAGAPGAGGITVADAGGMWLGPGGDISTPGGMLMAPLAPAATTSTMSIDANGSVTNATGALAGVTGVLAPSAIDGVLKLNGPVPGIFIFGIFGDRNHALFIDADGRIAVLQRDAGGLAGPYTDGDVQSATWSGTEVGVTGAFDPMDPSFPVITIDAAGMFTVANDPTTGTITSPPQDPGTGEYAGMFNDPGPPASAGPILALLTPDKMFAGTVFCTGTNFPADCRFNLITK